MKLGFDTTQEARQAGWNDYVVDPTHPVEEGYVRQTLVEDQADAYLDGLRQAQTMATPERAAAVERILREAGVTQRDFDERRVDRELTKLVEQWTRNDRLHAADDDETA